MPRRKLTDEERFASDERRRIRRRHYMRGYYRRHKAERIAAVIKWREANMDKYLEYQKQYRGRVE